MKNSILTIVKNLSIIIIFQIELDINVQNGG